MSHGMMHVAEAPTVRPSAELFEDPLALIVSLAPLAAESGIVRIVPPVQVSDAAYGSVCATLRSGGCRIWSRTQPIARQDWSSLDAGTQRFQWTPQPKSLQAFQKAAAARVSREFPGDAHPSVEQVEARFWQLMDAPAGERSTVVEYGDNIEGSAFKRRAKTRWRLQSLPHEPASGLRHLQHVIPGVNGPMMYHGMVFSTFCWHVEDLNLNSINYHHAGAPKVWYGVAARHADAFEAHVKSKVYAPAVAAMRAKDVPEHEIDAAVVATIAHKTTMFNPAELLAAGVPVTRAVQAAGEIVVTYPRGYHAGFSAGLNVGEAANFSVRGWAEFGVDSALRSLRLRQTPIMSVEHVVCAEALLMHRELRAARAAAAPAQRGRTFRSWLLAHGREHVTANDEATLSAFLRVLRWYHRTLSHLRHGSAALLVASDLGTVACGATKELLHLAAVPNGWEEDGQMAFESLSHARVGGATPARVLVSERLPRLLQIAQDFGALFTQQDLGAVQHDEWRTAGLTERLRVDVQLSDGIGACSQEDLRTPYSFAPIPLAEATSPAALAAAGVAHAPRRTVRLRLRPKPQSAEPAARDGTSSAESNTLGCAAAQADGSEDRDDDQPVKRRRGCRTLPPGVRIVPPSPLPTPCIGPSRNADPPARWLRRALRARHGRRARACTAGWCAALSSAPEGSAMPCEEDPVATPTGAAGQEEAAAPPCAELRCKAELAAQLLGLAGHSNSTAVALQVSEPQHSGARSAAPLTGSPRSDAAQPRTASDCIAGGERAAALAQSTAERTAAAAAARRASSESSHSALHMPACGAADAAYCIRVAGVREPAAGGAPHGSATQTALSPLSTSAWSSAACDDADPRMLLSPKRPRRVPQPVAGSLLQHLVQQ